MSELAGRLQAAGRQVYRLGFGQFPFPVPDAVVDELRSSAHEKDYPPTRGLPALRSAIADHFRSEFGVEAAADDVFIGPGSKELMFLLQLALYADLPAPCWVSYAPQARMLDRPIHLLPTRADDQWQIDPEALADVCRMDPVGTIVSSGLSKWCRAGGVGAWGPSCFRRSCDGCRLASRCWPARHSPLSVHLSSTPPYALTKAVRRSRSTGST